MTRSIGQLLRVVVWLVIAWTVMVMTHETGHLAGGCCSGAVLRDAELRPWRIPYSLFDPDPWPLVTLWAGPALGVVGPAMAAICLRHDGVSLVAGFCLLANGIYLGAGLTSNDRWLDSSRLLASGAAEWHILIFTALCLLAGYPLFRRSLIRLARC